MQIAGERVCEWAGWGGEMRNRMWMIWALAPACCAGCVLDGASGRVSSGRGPALKPAAAAAMQDCPPEMVTHEGVAAGVVESKYRQDRIPHAAIPAALGTAVHGWESAMICESQVQQQVLPRHAWYAAGAIPGPEGRRRIEQLSEQMRDSTGLLVMEAEPVQPEYDEELEEAMQRTDDLNSRRRAWVVGQLAACGVVNAEQRVVFSSERPVGIRGIEAPRVYNTLAGGGMGQGGGGGGGGMRQGGGMGGGMGGGGGFGGGGGLF